MCPHLYETFSGERFACTESSRRLCSMKTGNSAASNVPLTVLQKRNQKPRYPWKIRCGRFFGFFGEFRQYLIPDYKSHRLPKSNIIFVSSTATKAKPTITLHSRICASCALVRLLWYLCVKDHPN